MTSARVSRRERRPLAEERRFPNWFSGLAAEAAFARNLKWMAGKEGLRFLQLGAYAGDASRWLAQEVLNGSRSCLLDVDTWAGSDGEVGHSGIDWGEVYRFYEAHRPLNVTAWHGTTRAFFQQNIPPGFDFVYVDADHRARSVLADAVGAFGVLKVGGLLASDDFTWTDPERSGWDRPATAISAFFEVYRDGLVVVEIGDQAWFRKIAE